MAAPPFDPTLDPVQDAFVSLWGDMGSAWGINRTMAQLHALLYVTEEPLDTDTLMERLAISRGNANTNLRSLVAWGLVRKVRPNGSRKDYFEAEKDMWEITRRILEQREALEIRPALERLDALRAQTGASDPQLRERLDELAAFLRAFRGFAQVVTPLLAARNADLVQGLVAMLARMSKPEA
ncbi:MAG: hypothetical protein IAE99_08665 [Rhodothermales bacterium]|nr:hypothetical protein [Rhodothermales bacterium]